MNAHTPMLRPDPTSLKQSFALFPSGVVIATTIDAQGVSHGFTASTFVPLSVEPPMVLVCLNRSAQCYDAFLTSERFAVSVLRPEHQDIAMRFATRGADKFADRAFDTGAGTPPVLDCALAAFECSVADRHPGGDHIILTGLVERMRHTTQGGAMVHFARSFHAVEI
ncbi:flavin reductase family protein [Aquamicrobium sp. LC103]|uniref:flavin reductase family protein n=1 Tax=Aquamicrobium sp. LC103 TaxID=1120658 RepID=UPI0006995AF8|nr:flavin reductase family protein [Aquamicrobium sp. LC103]TKT75739.1 flavin reductase family protein [Aquamicrobium sp. LC103]